MVVQLGSPLIALGVIKRWDPRALIKLAFCNEPKAGMNVTLDWASRLVLVGELKVSQLLISFFLPKTRYFSKSIDGFLDMPDCVGLDNVHLHQDWW